MPDYVSKKILQNDKIFVSKKINEEDWKNLGFSHFEGDFAELNKKMKVMCYGVGKNVGYIMKEEDYNNSPLERKFDALEKITEKLKSYKNQKSQKELDNEYENYTKSVQEYNNLFNDFKNNFKEGITVNDALAKRINTMIKGGGKIIEGFHDQFTQNFKNKLYKKKG